MGVPSDLLGRGPLSSSGLRHDAVVTCTECAVGVIDQRAGGISAPVPRAGFGKLSVPALKAGVAGMRIGARRHQRAAAVLAEAAGAADRAANVVLVSAPPVSVRRPGLGR